MNLTRRVKQHIQMDYNAMVEREAQRAASAAETNDDRTLFKITDRMGAPQRRAVKGIFLKGQKEKTFDETKIFNRWQEYAADHFNGTVIGEDEIPDLAPVRGLLPLKDVAEYELMTEDEYQELARRENFTKDQAKSRLNSLPTRKADGLDLLVIEQVRAGGDTAMNESAEMILKWSAARSAPVRWRGGRFADIDKNCGDPADPDMNRIVQCTDHH